MGGGNSFKIPILKVKCIGLNLNKDMRFLAKF